MSIFPGIRKALKLEEEPTDKKYRGFQVKIFSDYITVLGVGQKNTIDYDPFYGVEFRSSALKNIKTMRIKDGIIDIHSPLSRQLIVWKNPWGGAVIEGDKKK